MTSIATTLSRDWQVAVGRLTTAETHAAHAWTWLTAQAPMELISAVPELRTEYATLHGRGKMIEGTIHAVRAAVTGTMKAVQQAYRGSVDFAAGLFGVGELGLVGLVSAAAILSAVAAITYWVTEVVAFREKVAAIQRLVQEGMTPAAAAAALKANPGILGQTALAAKSLAVLLGVGAVVLFIVKWKGARK